MVNVTAPVVHNAGDPRRDRTFSYRLADPAGRFDVAARAARKGLLGGRGGSERLALLIVDHLGLFNVNTAGLGMSQAIDRTVSLSRYPNVHVKLSSMPYYSVEAYPFKDMYPHVRRLIEAYGPRRCFWGTDLSKLLPRGHSYRTCIDHAMGLDFLSHEDREWIMGRGIAECLGWPLPASKQ